LIKFKKLLSYTGKEKAISTSSTIKVGWFTITFLLLYLICSYCWIYSKAENLIEEVAAAVSLAVEDLNPSFFP